MRRWIFAVLVLLNVGLFLWGVQYVEPERPVRDEAAEEVNPDRMKLLSELPPNKLAARPKPPPPPPPPVKLSNDQQCYRVGPIAQVEHLQKIEAALGAQQLAFTRREETASNVTGYRVFLPSFPSRPAAERRRRELTQLGFKDHALMQDEGFQNAISLGLFSVEENARNHLQRLAEKGVKAEIRAVEQTRKIHWLEVTPAQTAPDLPYLPDQLKSLIKDAQDAEINEMPCPAPVSPAAPAPEPAKGD